MRNVLDLVIDRVNECAQYMHKLPDNVLEKKLIAWKERIILNGDEDGPVTLEELSAEGQPFYEGLTSYLILNRRHVDIKGILGNSEQYIRMLLCPPQTI